MAEDSVRYECAVEGFEDCWIELSLRWTRGEVKRLVELASGDDYWELVKDKMIALHLVCVEGHKPITKPEQFVDENTDNMDFVLWTWCTNVPWALLRTLSNEGEAAGRELFDISEPETE